MKFLLYLILVSCCARAGEIEVYAIQPKQLKISSSHVRQRGQGDEELVAVQFYVRGKLLETFSLTKGLDQIYEDALNLKLQLEGPEAPFFGPSRPFLLKDVGAKRWFIVAYEYAPGIRFRLYKSQVVPFADVANVFHSSSIRAVSNDPTITGKLKNLVKPKQ